VHELVFNTCDSNMHGERIKKSRLRFTLYSRCFLLLSILIIEAMRFYRTLVQQSLIIIISSSSRSSSSSSSSSIKFKIYILYFLNLSTNMYVNNK
jgi:hypothetical protein